jgi:hypothetical protein
MALRDELLSGLANRQTVINFPNAEYANITSGFHDGTISLDEKICDDEELDFNVIMSSLFSATIQGISDITGLKIYAYQTIGAYTVNLFTGYVQSAQYVSGTTHRKVLAYDVISYHANDNMATWYNTVFASGDVTVKTFRDSLFAEIGITQVTATLVNDTVLLKKTLTSTTLPLIQLLGMICEFNGVIGHATRTGTFQYIDLSASTNYDVSDNFRTTTTKEEFTTTKIGKVRIVTDTLTIEYGAGTNIYTVANNTLLNGLSNVTLTAIATAMYNKVKDIEYRPCDIRMTISEPNLTVGDKITISTARESIVTYVMQNILSGVQMFTQEILATGSQLRADSQTDGSNEISAIREEAKKYQWLIESGTNATNFELTDRSATLVADYINLNGLVAITGLEDATIQAINDEIVIGGRNLLKLSNAISLSASNYTNTTNVFADGIGTLTVIDTGIWSNYFTATALLADTGILSNIGEYYTMSVDINADILTADTFEIYCRTSGTENKYSTYTPVTDTGGNWIRYSVLFQVTIDTNTSFRLVFVNSAGGSIGDVIQYRNFKLERGNKASDWTYAIEDIDTNINDASIANWAYNNDTTYFDGGKIYTGTVIGNAILAKTITADKLTIGTNGYCVNPRLDDWTNTYPYGTYAWSTYSTGVSKVTVNAQNIIQMVCDASNPQGLRQRASNVTNGFFTYQLDLSNKQYLAVEYKFKLTSGTNPTGAGILLDTVYYPNGSATLTDIFIQCKASDLGTTLTANTWYTYRKIVEIPAVVLSGQFAYLSGYFMGNYNMDSEGYASKTIQFSSFNVFPATEQDFLTQSWTSVGASTFNGANIETGTVTATQINVDNLFAQDINFTGKITGGEGGLGGIIESYNYVEDVSGTTIDLVNGTFETNDGTFKGGKTSITDKVNYGLFFNKYGFVCGGSVDHNSFLEIDSGGHISIEHVDDDGVPDTSYVNLNSGSLIFGTNLVGSDAELSIYQSLIDMRGTDLKTQISASNILVENTIGTAENQTWLDALGTYIYDGATQYATKTTSEGFYSIRDLEARNLIRESTSGNVVISQDVAGTGETYIYGGETDKVNILNDAYVYGNCSAASFTDRTPFYTGNALEELNKIKGKDGLIEHATLPEFARAKIEKSRDKKTGVVEYEDGRDLGGLLSVVTKAIQELIIINEEQMSRIEKLEKSKEKG